MNPERLLKLILQVYRGYNVPQDVFVGRTDRSIHDCLGLEEFPAYEMMTNSLAR